MPPRKMPERTVVEAMYWVEGLGPKAIGERLGLSANTVLAFMRREGIARRTREDGTRLAIARGERPVRPPGQTPKKDVLRCRHCQWVWLRQDARNSEACPRCGRLKDTRARSVTATEKDKASIAGLHAWKAAHPDAVARYKQGARRSALLLVGRGLLVCVHCGCDRPELLEINHKNGGGAAEMRAVGGSTRFYRAIMMLTRSVEDLELCCKVCNAQHCLELRYGPLPFEIIYRRDQA